MSKKYLCEDWKAGMQLSINFSHMMADFAGEARAAVRSDLRKVAHTLEGKELDKVQAAIATLPDRTHAQEELHRDQGHVCHRRQAVFRR